MFKLCLSWYPMITSGSGIGASFGFHQSPLLSVARFHYGMDAFLWISSGPSSVFLRDTSLFCQFVWNFWVFRYLWPIARLHNLLMLNISFGCCRHSVFNTSVQLTEGRLIPSSFQQKNHCIGQPGSNLKGQGTYLMGEGLEEIVLLAV